MNDRQPSPRAHVNLHEKRHGTRIGGPLEVSRHEGPENERFVLKSSTSWSTVACR